jgi:hypothetical protein
MGIGGVSKLAAGFLGFRGGRENRIISKRAQISF